MLKSLARFAFIAAALVLVSSAVSGQTPNTIRLSPQAVHVLDSIATAARVKRVETAACVNEFTLDPLTIDVLGPATYVFADSISINTKTGTGLCPLGVPTIHTHVAYGGVAQASEVDVRQKFRDGVPFALILVVRDGTSFMVRY